MMWLGVATSVLAAPLTWGAAYLGGRGSPGAALSALRWALLALALMALVNWMAYRDGVFD